MPWLFLVAVIRPLSMSFSFDASGKVYLPAYLAFYLLLFPSLLWLLICSPACTHVKHTVSAHCRHISCHASVVGDGCVVCGGENMVMWAQVSRKTLMTVDSSMTHWPAERTYRIFNHSYRCRAVVAAPQHWRNVFHIVSGEFRGFSNLDMLGVFKFDYF